jgi:hypothetical protein
MAAYIAHGGQGCKPRKPTFPARPFPALSHGPTSAIHFAFDSWSLIMKLPTAARFPNPQEWEIVEMVFTGKTLPFRNRVLIMNGLGAGGAPFTIPTAALSVATLPAALSAAMSGLAVAIFGGRDGALARGSNRLGLPSLGTLGAQVLGIVNLGYLINVGPTNYPNLTASETARALLVHEMTHVWQGRNSASSTTYLYNSILHQCTASASGPSRGGAYRFTEGQPWSTYNAEQQAKIIETWYVEGASPDHALFPYIRDKVRNGIT